MNELIDKVKGTIEQRASVLIASAMLALGAGCAVEPVEGQPTYVDGATVVSGQGDADVIYVQEPPVVDIETYPSAVYGGVTVYYVGGQWYQQGPHGWGYYRHEPGELARERESHDSDPRWQRARDAPRRGDDQRGPPAPVARPEQAPPPAQAPRVEQAARPEPIAPPPRPAAIEPRAPERNVAPAPEPARKEEVQPVPAPRRARPQVKRGPVEPVRR